MTASGGVVLLSAAQDRGVFLTSADLANLRETLDDIIEKPTVAGGPLDLTGLERLARAVELAEEDKAPITLQAIEESGLELVKEQAAIRANLPLRIRRTCKECGHQQVINPKRQAQQTQSSGPGSDTVATSVSLLTEGHPFLATLNLFTGSDSSAAGPEQPACTRCDGDDFGSDTVTICPGCRAFRDESVLLNCPECEFDFHTRAVNDPFWVPRQRAVTDAALARNATLLKDKAAGQFWDGQLQAMAAALRPDEKLLGLCRCGLPTEVGRYVALLFTSNQLIWARQSPMSNTTSGCVRWSDVVAVYPFNSVSDKGIQLDSRTGPALVFTNFKGTGITFNGESTNVTVDAIHTLVHTLWAPHRPATPPPPRPDWYPDPWRVARLRWWDGSQWTSHLRA
jgi:hypothetical protein